MIDTNILGIIIGILELIITIWPIIGNKEQYFDYPYFENDTFASVIYAKRAGLLWKINWILSSCIIGISYLVIYEIIDLGITSKDSSSIFFALCLIQMIGIGSKDIFHNWIAYKEKTKILFKKMFDSLDALNLIIIIQILMFAVVALVFWIFYRINIKIALLISTAFFVVFSCVYRIIEEMSKLTHLYNVNNLSVLMVDGTCYNKIKDYKDLGSTIRIISEPNTIEYLSKNMICRVSKTIDNQTLLDAICEKSSKKKRSTTIKKNKSTTTSNQMLNNEYENKKSNATNLMIALLSCSLAPVISHILDLYSDNNIWNTERILILYFSSATGFIIQDKLARLVKDIGLYNKGFRLGDSDALNFYIWLLPVSIVTIMYDDFICLVVLAVMNVVAIIILAQDYKKIKINARKMILIGIVLLFLIKASISMRSIFETKYPLVSYLIIIVSVFIACTIWDLTMIMFKKFKQKSNL